MIELIKKYNGKAEQIRKALIKQKVFMSVERIEELIKKTP